jgi:hypothetical protein
MIEDIPDMFARDGYFLGYDSWLWYTAAFITLLGGYYFLARRKYEENKFNRQWHLGVAIFLMAYGIARLCFILAVELGYPSSGLEVYNFWTGLGYIFALVASLGLVIAAEKNLLQRTHMTLSWVLVVGLAISIIGLTGQVYDRTTTLLISDIMSAFAFVLIVAIYIFLIKNSAGELRQKTVGAFVGMMVWYVAVFSDGQFVYGLVQMPTLLPPLMYIAGVILFIAFQRMT